MTFHVRTLKRTFAGLALAVCGISQTAPAQGAASISGKVTDARSGEPMAGVQIVIPGTTQGVVTNAAGEYRIGEVASGPVRLRARRIGYGATDRTVTVTGSPVSVDFALSPVATDLDAVVITGTPGETSKRTLGNAITQLNVAELTDKSSLTNVTDVLQSKTPGVTLLPASGTPGASADIRIRGTSSLSGSNRPIFYIDGIRYSDASMGNYAPSGSGSSGVFAQGASALDAISPGDIESIEVIKGPAAATLYGAEAAGGVIQIITKKGSRGSTRARWNVKAEMGRSDWALATPVNYTTCTADRIALTTSVGGVLEPTWPGCQGLAPGTVISNEPLRDAPSLKRYRDGLPGEQPDALREGDYRNLAVSVRGGADRYTYYLSGDRITDEGVFLNSFNNRKGGRGNFTFRMSDKIDFAVNTAYIQTHLRLPLNDDAAAGLIISAVRGQPGARAPQVEGFRINGPEFANRYDNQTRAERTIFGGTVNYKPTTWLRNKFTAGMDFNSPLAAVYYPPTSADFPSGFLAQRTPQTHLYTFDYAGTLTKSLRPWLKSDFSVGVQGTKNEFRRTEASGSGFPTDDFRLIGAATTVTGSSGFSEQSSLGYFLQETLGFNNRVFLTGALRADDNSAFGVEFDRVFYPKASLSWIVSEEPRLVGFFDRIRADNVKLRVAYGHAGRSPGPYDAVRTYTSGRVVIGNAVGSALVPSAPGNANLRAERGVELEYGIDAAFLKDRLGLEFSAYNKQTRDALISVSNAPSTGFSAGKFANFGLIKNWGIELGIRARPIDMDRFRWESNLTYATNQNRLERFGFPGITEIIPYNPYAPATAPLQVHREGFPLAGYWAVGAKKTNGVIDTLRTGAVVVETVPYYVGPPTPKFEGAFSNTFTIMKNVRLYGLIDFKGGHFLFNQKDRNRDQTANRNSLRFNNGSLSRLDSAFYSSNVTETWIQPADFVKLRDISVAVTLPKAFTDRLRAGPATFTVAGHNLGFISKKYPGIDPEVNFYGASTFSLAFVRTDSYTMPMIRRFTAGFNVSY